MVYHFEWRTPGARLRVFADTDFAGCLKTRRSTSGGCALRGAHLLKHWSTTQKTITLSSGEAELCGLVKAASEGLGLQSLSQDLCLDSPLELYVDSSEGNRNLLPDGNWEGPTSGSRPVVDTGAAARGAVRLV